MGIGEIILDAVKFPSSNWMKVLILGVFFILSFIIIGIFFVLGYFLRIIKSTIVGMDELPEFDDLGDMFIDGVKVLAVIIIYMLILVIVVGVSAYLSMFLDATSAGIYTVPTSFFALGVTGFIGLILALIFGLFAYIAVVNMALHDEIEAAFRFREILDKIKMIGWGKYIIWYIIMLIIVLVVALIGGILSSLFTFIGLIAYLVIYPYFVILFARSLGLIFVSSEQYQEPIETESTV